MQVSFFRLLILFEFLCESDGMIYYIKLPEYVDLAHISGWEKKNLTREVSEMEGFPQGQRNGKAHPLPFTLCSFQFSCDISPESYSHLVSPGMKCHSLQVLWHSHHHMDNNTLFSYLPSLPILSYWILFVLCCFSILSAPPNIVVLKITYWYHCRYSHEDERATTLRSIYL
jgi:hypothetical protein